MQVSLVHIVGILLTVGLLLVVGILSGRKVRDARSFVSGGRSGSWMVCGIIMGTLVGGQSTIGTAQLAFCYGLSAWWFTIGAALGCVVLALFYVVPLRRSGCVTLSEIVAREYGHKAEAIGSVLCMMGMFISIVSQVLASSAMLTSLFGVSAVLAAVLSALLIVCFVFLGGIRSAGIGGLLKVVLLYVSSVAAAVMVWRMSGGLRGVCHDVQQLFVQRPELLEFCDLPDVGAVGHRFGSLVARGPLKDVGSGLSLLLGVVSTQTYAQGVWAARSYRTARRGVLLSALLVPVIGAACTLVGLYMRGHYVTLAEQQALLAAGRLLPEGVGVMQGSAEVFPRFILDVCPDGWGGILLGTLFVTVLGGGSGLALGVATILVHNVICNLNPALRQRGRDIRWLYRASIAGIAGVVMLAAFVALHSHRTLINDLGFLSLGLRATALLLPLSCALFLPGILGWREMVAAMIAGTATMIVAFLLSLPADPIFYGLGIEVVICFAAYLVRRRRAGYRSSSMPK